ncbi:MAG: hypothetical protein ABJL67_11870 [Sulfitobacter sp.]
MILSTFSISGYILGFGLGEQEGERKGNANNYAHHAQSEINRACRDADTVAQAECISRVIQATNEHKRSESDLVAQRNMSRWAGWMLLVTAVMAIITTAGVYFVWRTLKATQKMADDTRRIGEAQVRAYLSIEDVSVEIDMMDGIVVQNIAVRIGNSGQSPAREVMVSTCFTDTPGSNLYVDWPDISAGTSHTKVSNLSTPKSELVFGNANETHIVVFVTIRIRHRDVFGRRHELLEEFQARCEYASGAVADMNRGERLTVFLDNQRD